jgi:hypothetical protein
MEPGDTMRQLEQQYQTGRECRRGPAVRVILIRDGKVLRPPEVKPIR